MAAVVEAVMDGADLGPGDSDASLVDVTRMPLETLMNLNDSVLVNALRRLLAELDHPHEIIAAFDNFAGDPPLD